jgi:hypothetical protein
MNTFNPKEYKVVALREAHGPFVCPDCRDEVRRATLNLATDFAPPANVIGGKVTDSPFRQQKFSCTEIKFEVAE